MNDMTVPAKGIAVGAEIEYDLMPGFIMQVQGVRRCETDTGRPELHDAYQVTDPDGNTDWLCAYDVHTVGSPAEPALD